MTKTEYVENGTPEPLDLEAARRLRGSGWHGDLEEMRGGAATPITPSAQ